MKTGKKSVCRKLALVLATVLMLSAVLPGCGSATQDKPGKLGSAMAFNSWFGTGKKCLTNTETAGSYYFKVTKDVKLNKMSVIDNGHHVVIDLDGHIISGKNKDRVQAFYVAEGATLTLQNGAIEMPGAADDGGLIKVEGAGSSLNLVNMTLTNTDDSEGKEKSGGVLSVSSPVEEAPAVVTVQGTSVINGSVEGRRYGGSVSLAGNAEMYMLGGVIQNGKAGDSGNVHMKDSAKFYMVDGIISGGVAERVSQTSGMGGNVNVRGKARFHLYGGTVTGGTADVSGGNFFISSFGSEDPQDGFHMFGGKIEQGVALQGGGNIYASEKSSVLTLLGGEILDGKSITGGNIYLEASALELRGGKLLGLGENSVNVHGGNVYVANGTINIYSGQIRDAVTTGSGANIYADSAVINMYGGTVTGGSTSATEVNAGGGNFWLNGDSQFNLYDGEIEKGESNRNKEEEASAAGGNVVISGHTKMEMFGGLIKDGIVHGKICRGGCIYIYGQPAGYDAVFHMYGGKIENGLLDTETMRGMGVGAYSESKGTRGSGVARIFDGVISFTGSEKDKDKRHMLYSNRSKPAGIQIFNEVDYQGLYRGADVGACPHAGHNTETEKVAATCVTPGYTRYTCPTCGDWCQITEKALGHTETETVVAATCTTPGYTQHSCESCGVLSVTDIVAPDGVSHTAGEDGKCTRPGCNK